MFYFSFDSILFLSNLFKNRLFPFNNNKWEKKAVSENPKNFKKKKKRSKEEIDVGEKEVKE